jgi:hypothetical protein
MNDNHPARSGLAIVGGDDDLAHSFFFAGSVRSRPIENMLFQPSNLMDFS